MNALDRGSEGLYRPFEGLYGPSKGLYRRSVALHRPSEALHGPLEGLYSPFARCFGLDGLSSARFIARMPKKAAITTPATPASDDSATEVGLPTAADLAFVSTLLPAIRENPIRMVSTTLVDYYADPAVTTILKPVQKDLAGLAGLQNAIPTLALAPKAVKAAGAFLRLQAAANRAGQFVIQTTKAITKVDTALSDAHEGTNEGTPVNTALGEWAGNRAAKLAVKKGKRTKKKNKGKPQPATKS